MKKLVKVALVVWNVAKRFDLEEIEDIYAEVVEAIEKIKAVKSAAKKDKKGRFAMAEGGTLLLDEIGDVSQAMQVKLLRVLQEKTYEPLGGTVSVPTDVRVIAATNKGLDHLVQADEFRSDLYYRINVIRVRLPSLQDRKEDIPLLVDHFVDRFNRLRRKNVPGLSPPALGMLLNHDFPGNIRELENIARYLLVVVDSDVIEPQDLPFFYDLEKRSPVERVAAAPRSHSAVSPPPERAGHHGLAFGNRTWEQVERAYVRHLLHKHDGNVTRAAREAAVNRSTFASRMRKLKIDRNRGKQGRIGVR